MEECSKMGGGFGGERKTKNNFILVVFVRVCVSANAKEAVFINQQQHKQQHKQQQ